MYGWNMLVLDVKTVQRHSPPLASSSWAASASLCSGHILQIDWTVLPFCPLALPHNLILEVTFGHFFYSLQRIDAAESWFVIRHWTTKKGNLHTWFVWNKPTVDNKNQIWSNLNKNLLYLGLAAKIWSWGMIRFMRRNKIIGRNIIYVCMQNIDIIIVMNITDTTNKLFVCCGAMEWNCPLMTILWRSCSWRLLSYFPLALLTLCNISCINAI